MAQDPTPGGGNAKDPLPNHCKRDYDFSVDLISNASDHIGFLRGLHANGITLQRPTERSAHRYKLWLDMVRAIHEDCARPGQTREPPKLIPPADVAWLWHCHRLAPMRYVEYLKERYGSSGFILLEANPPFDFQTENGTDGAQSAATVDDDEKTRQLWNRHHPTEPFFLSESSWSHANESQIIERGPESPSTPTSLLSGFDVIESAERQSTFLWQVSQPNFFKDGFLRQGLAQYTKFLQLRRIANTKQVTIVPTYQIDLFWHTHILANMQGYFDDCKQLLGYILHHDDSLTDRSEGGVLDTSFRETQELWQEHYGEAYKCPGGMYRGEPPKTFYHAHWPQQLREQIEWEQGVGPYINMIHVQGATSTNPDSKFNTSNALPVWQYKSDGGVWMDYGAAERDKINAAYSTNPTDKAFHLETDRHTLIIDFEQNVQVNHSTQKRNTIRRQHVLWQHQRDGTDITWEDYAIGIQVLIEAAHQEQDFSKKIFEAKIGSKTFAIDTLGMTQVDLGHKDASPSKIRRQTQDTVSVATSEGYGGLDPLATAGAQIPDTATSLAPQDGAIDYTASWTPVDGTTKDGKPGFVAAGPKTTRPDLGNPPRDDYIFDNGSLGVGYYHQTTNDAQYILLKRVSQKRARLEDDRGTIMCVSILCLCGLPLCLGATKGISQEIAALDALATAIRVRVKSAGPSAPIALPSNVTSRLYKENRVDVIGQAYDAKRWNALFMGAAACGAVGAGHQMSGVNRGGGTTSYGNTGGYYYGYGSKCDACTGKHEPRIGTNCADSSSDNSCCTSRIWTFTKPHLAPKLAIAWLGTTLLQTALFIVVASRSDGRSSSCLQVWRIANAEV